MAFQFKVQLLGINKPPVWRRLLVPETMTFHRFHNTIQAAFGWTNSHLYEFTEAGYGSSVSIQVPYPDVEEDIVNSKKTRLKDIFEKEKQTFIYIYDFGDDWKHEITLEKITPDKITTPSCIEGNGKCPPEDCGGVWGYENFLKIVNDPKHPEYEEMREWAFLEEDEVWDTGEFDLEEANAEIKIFWKED